MQWLSSTEWFGDSHCLHGMVRLGVVGQGKEIHPPLFQPLTMKSSMAIQSVSLKELPVILSVMYRVNKPIFLWGKSGAAKSTSVHNFVERMRRSDYPDFGFVDLRASQLDPVDTRGLPSVDKEKHIAEWIPFDVFPIEERDGKHGIVLLEEFNSAAPTVQTSFYEFLFDRRIGKYNLPDGWRVWACGNRDEDGGVTFQVPSPNANRFAQHILVEPTIEDYISNAQKTGIRLDVMAFLRWRPELLFTYDPQNPCLTFCTLRTWDYLSHICNAWESDGRDLKDPLFLICAQNCLGEGAGVEFYGFLDYYRKLPNLDELIRDPENAQVYSSSDAHLNWAVVCGLYSKADKKNAGQIIKYAMRMPPEFSVVLVQDCMADVEGFTECPEMAEWSMKFQDVILD